VTLNQLVDAVAGHSAGAHLASGLGLRNAALATTDPARVDGVCAISGIYDLAPLLDTTLNQRLRLDTGSARAQSTLSQVGATGVPAVWLVGGAETPAFLAQDTRMHQRWQAQGHWSQCIEAPQADHFTVLQDWAALRGPLADGFERWWAQVAARHAAAG